MEAELNDKPKMNDMQEVPDTGSNVSGSQEALRNCIANLARHAANPDRFVTIGMPDERNAK
ncbi:hypothetical protein LCGC14_0228170 [marine sediment metagenome]|uniref:Uncharacterized protein n=1 Tax=marine sediment metagenome TaxID=412755 RepID=A0A0F9XF56_9ZZZZ